MAEPTEQFEILINGEPVIVHGRKLPSKLAMAKSAAVAVGQVISQGAKKVSVEEEARRIAICKGCEFFLAGNRCAKCGCYLNLKTLLASWHCPIAKW